MENKQIKKRNKKTNEAALWTAKPAKRRLIFRWLEIAIFAIPVYVLWTIWMDGVTLGLVFVTSGFLALFFAAAIWLSLILRKRTQYVITTKNIFTKAGLTSTLISKIPLSQVVFFRKVTTIADIFMKKTTGTVEIFVIRENKNGRKTLQIDPICSMYGIKSIHEPINILKGHNIQEVTTKKQIRIKKLELQLEWTNHLIEKSKKQNERKQKSTR